MELLVDICSRASSLHCHFGGNTSNDHCISFSELECPLQGLFQLKCLTLNLEIPTSKSKCNALRYTPARQFFSFIFCHFFLPFRKQVLYINLNSQMEDTHFISTSMTFAVKQCLQALKGYTKGCR